jgi:hypothetical protein
MRPTSIAIRIVAPLAAACLFAACSGGQSTGVVPQTGTPASIGQSQNAQSVQRAPEGQTVDPDGSNCKTTGKRVSVSPCAIQFDLLHLLPVTSKVKARKNAEIKESDNCNSQGIATITGGDRTYTVTPGLLGGTCKAVFTATHGKKEYGSATMTIVHTLL